MLCWNLSTFKRFVDLKITNAPNDKAIALSIWFIIKVRRNNDCLACQIQKGERFHNVLKNIFHFFSLKRVIVLRVEN